MFSAPGNSGTFVGARIVGTMTIRITFTDGSLNANVDVQQAAQVTFEPVHE